MLPPLDPVSGHLPIGRHSATLREVEDCFVLSPQFGASATRQEIWTGFERWLGVWGAVEDSLAVPGLLRTLWISGSFVSAEMNPGDIDVTPFVDGELRDQCRGRTGAGAIRALVGDRTKVAEEYLVEPFVVWWRSVGAILQPTAHSAEEREYLSRRGGMDDLWQRVRPPGLKGPLTAASAAPRRGYVEVIL